MAITTFTGGTGIASSPMNNNFKGMLIQEVYSGTGLDLTFSTSTGSAAHEFTAISSSDIGNADYLVIRVTGESHGDSNSNAGAAINLQLETKETGSGYVDTLATSTIFSTSADTVGEKVTSTFEWVHTLTSGEKTNGVEVRATTSKGLSGTSSVGYTLRQATIKLGT